MSVGDTPIPYVVGESFMSCEVGESIPSGADNESMRLKNDGLPVPRRVGLVRPRGGVGLDIFVSGSEKGDGSI